MNQPYLSDVFWQMWTRAVGNYHGHKPQECAAILEIIFKSRAKKEINLFGCDSFDFTEKCFTSWTVFHKDCILLQHRPWHSVNSAENTVVVRLADRFEQHRMLIDARHCGRPWTSSKECIPQWFHSFTALSLTRESVDCGATTRNVNKTTRQANSYFSVVSAAILAPRHAYVAV